MKLYQKGSTCLVSQKVQGFKPLGVATLSFPFGIFFNLPLELNLLVQFHALLFSGRLSREELQISWKKLEFQWTNFWTNSWTVPINIPTSYPPHNLTRRHNYGTPVITLSIPRVSILLKVRNCAQDLNKRVFDNLLD